MKTILTVLMATIVLLIGCDTSTDLTVNPAENNSDTQVSDSMDYELMPLPKKSALWMDSVYTFSQVIDGSVGGRMILENYYISDDGDSVSFKGDLTIPKGAFQGVKTIIMSVDNNYAFIHFYPEMLFEKELKFSQSFKGLNLENYESGKIDFCFLGADGTIEIIKRDGVEIKLREGEVKVSKAKLHHFSKYGWVRKHINGN